MAVKFYKHGDRMAIWTDCEAENDFMQEVSQSFAGMIERGDFAGDEVNAQDWTFQFERWLPCIVDICCAYRGYKNSVDIRKVLVSGDLMVVGEPVYVLNKLRDIPS